MMVVVVMMVMMMMMMLMMMIIMTQITVHVDCRLPAKHKCLTS
jgi:hypothetical protein